MSYALCRFTTSTEGGTRAPEKETTARMKINKRLETAGWRFIQDGDALTNIRAEPSVVIKPAGIDSLGDNIEKDERDIVGFLPIVGKEN
ncbi:MAG: hypothetical protein ACOY90_06465 [Candidatus Zhuqueibacterota bacterium]